MLELRTSSTRVGAVDGRLVVIVIIVVKEVCKCLVADVEQGESIVSVYVKIA